MKTLPFARTFTLLAAAALSLPLLAAPPDDAPGAQRQGPGMMHAVDTDGDGRISRAEFDAAGARAFARLDEDGDGFVTMDEFEAGPHMGRQHAGPGAKERRTRMQERMKLHRAQRFVAADANEDSILSRAEFDAARATRFDELDRDDDGSIDADEMARHRAERPHHGKRDR
ncbi:hypothetical protein [Wenzhouxiangella sp. XN24]|uniref:hypothetical protein n=1 Tax=Wenzhouxiangella sp. XN24 TaxID=2713569 RepID=UPI0013EDB1A7|nr:hypothetical protein [Wenzhouxiangella sp. XN24]NGX17416.1 hypothetical protein [Wenzhouxiangella sp. XN24]